MPGNATDLKGIITQARAKGVPDSETVSYLQGKGLIDQSGKPMPQFGNSQRPLASFASPLTTMDPTGAQGKAMVSGALPLAGSIGGTALGGMAGIPGGPAGIYAGGVIGSGVGAAAGEVANQAISGQKIDLPGAAKTGAAYGVMEAIGGPVTNFLGKSMKAIGTKIGTKVGEYFIPRTMQEAKMLQTYKAINSFTDRVWSALAGDSKAPTTAASVSFSQGLWGTESMIGVQAKKAQTKIWDNLIAPALKQSKTEVDMGKFFDEAQAKIDAGTQDETRKIGLTNALRSLRQDNKKVVTASLEKLQGLKEGWAEFVPEAAYSGKPIAGFVNDVRDTLADLAREKIYNELGDNVKQAYLDYGNLNGIKALGQKAMTGAVKGGTGTSLRNIWEQATIPVGTVAGQTIYKVGDIGEFVGLPGMKTFGAILGIGQPSTAPAATPSQPPAATVPPTPQAAPAMPLPVIQQPK